MNKSTATKKVYLFDRLLLQDRELRTYPDRPMAELQRLTARVWSSERLSQPMPRVVGGRGLSSGIDGLCSWTDGDVIVLARHQRNVGTLLHEIAHVIQGDRGYQHGPAYQRTYFALLRAYGGVPIWAILNLEHGSGLK